MLRVPLVGGVEKWEDRKNFNFSFLFGWEWKSEMMEKMSLYNLFIHPC